MKFTTVQKAVLSLVVANIIWGAASPIFKLALTNIPPFTLAFWRFFIGAMILLTVFGPRVANPKTLIHKDIRYLILYTLSGITFNIIFYFLGLQLTLSINAPIIASSAPILTMVCASVLLKEMVTKRKIFGMLFGTMGILTIVLEPLLVSGVDGSVLGNVFLILATVGAVGQTIIGRIVLPKYNPTMFTFWAFVIGSFTFFPLALYEYATMPNLYMLLSWNGYVGIVYGALFSSVLGYTLFAWGISKIQATDASLFTYIDPVVGTVLGYFLLSEPITPLFIIGSIFIFAGIFIAEGRIHYHPLQKLLRS